ITTTWSVANAAAPWRWRTPWSGAGRSGSRPTPASSTSPTTSSSPAPAPAARAPLRADPGDRGGDVAIPPAVSSARLAGGRLDRDLAVDPRLEGVPGLEGRDQRVARLGPGVVDHVPEPLGVDHHLHPRVERDPALGGGVLLLLAQDEGRTGGCVQLQPGADDPALTVRIEPIVVVEVKLAESGGLVARVELDHPHPAVACPDLLNVADQRGSDLPVLGPDAVLVGLAVVPESAALHLAKGGGERREVGVAAGLPVDELQALPLGRGDRRAPVFPQDDETGGVENGELAVCHGAGPLS